MRNVQNHGIIKHGEKKAVLGSYGISNSENNRAFIAWYNQENTLDTIVELPENIHAAWNSKIDQNGNLVLICELNYMTSSRDRFAFLKFNSNYELIWYWESEDKSSDGYFQFIIAPDYSIIFF